MKILGKKIPFFRRKPKRSIRIKIAYFVQKFFQAVLTIIKLPFIFFTSLLLSLIFFSFAILSFNLNITKYVTGFYHQSQNCIPIARYCFAVEKVNFGQLTVNGFKRINLSVSDFRVLNDHKPFIDIEKTEIQVNIKDLLRFKFVPIIKNIKNAEIHINDGVGSKKSLLDSKELYNIQKKISRFIGANIANSKFLKEPEIVSNVKIHLNYKEIDDALDIQYIKKTYDPETLETYIQGGLKIGSQQVSWSGHQNVSGGKKTGVKLKFFHVDNLNSSLTIEANNDYINSKHGKKVLELRSEGFFFEKIKPMSKVSKLEGLIELDLSSARINCPYFRLTGENSNVDISFNMSQSSYFAKIKTDWVKAYKIQNLLKGMNSIKQIKNVNKNIKLLQGDIKIDYANIAIKDGRVKDLLIDLESRNLSLKVKEVKNLLIEQINSNFIIDKFGYSIEANNVKFAGCSGSIKSSGFFAPKKDRFFRNGIISNVVTLKNQSVDSFLNSKELRLLSFDFLKTLDMKGESFDALAQSDVVFGGKLRSIRFSINSLLKVRNFMTKFNDKVFDTSFSISKSLNSKKISFLADLSNSAWLIGGKYVVKSRSDSFDKMKLVILSDAKKLNIETLKIFSEKSNMSLLDLSLEVLRVGDQSIKLIIKESNLAKNIFCGSIDYNPNKSIVVDLRGESLEMPIFISLINIFTNDDSQGFRLKDYDLVGKLNLGSVFILNDVLFHGFVADLDIRKGLVYKMNVKTDAQRDRLIKNIGESLAFVQENGAIDINWSKNIADNASSFVVKIDNTYLFLDAIGMNVFPFVAGATLELSGTQNAKLDVHSNFTFQDSFISFEDNFNGIVEEEVDEFDFRYDVRDFVSSSSKKTSGFRVDKITGSASYIDKDSLILWDQVDLNGTVCSAFNNFGLYKIKEDQIYAEGQLSLSLVKKKKEYISYKDLIDEDQGAAGQRSSIFSVYYKIDNKNTDQIFSEIAFIPGNLISSPIAVALSSIAKKQ